MASSFSDFLKAALSGDMRLLKKFVAKLDNDGEGSLAKILDFDGRTALHLAAGAGHTHICKHLIQKLKFDVNIEDRSGQTPLVYAIMNRCCQTALYLVDNGASISKIFKDDIGFTPLHVAASFHGNGDLVNQLISRGADIEADSDEGTPLTWAATQGSKDGVEVLLQNKANPDPVKSFDNPLMRATKVSLACTDLLVKAGADPNMNYCGGTPLQSAVVAEKIEIVMYLLKAGANPNVVNYAGLTALEIAASCGNVKAMVILFPVTTPIPSIEDWSIKGIIKYVNSEEAKKKIYLMCKQFFHMANSKGEEALEKADYWVAINWYYMASMANPTDANVLCNKSLCYARLGRGMRALSDAKDCVNLRPDWPKAHYREGVAWKLLKKYNEAAKSFSRALKLDPNNLEFQQALREAVEAEIADMGI